MELELVPLLRAIRTALRTSGVPHMLAGSVASAAFGLIRATQDIDIVIDPTAKTLDALLIQFPEREYYVSADAAHTALAHGGMFNIIALESLWKIDFIIRRHTPHGEVEFDRRLPLDVAGVTFDVATAEDSIISKLAWAAVGRSARQLEDVRALRTLRAGQLDEAYLHQWIDRLGLTSLWQEATGC